MLLKPGRPSFPVDFKANSKTGYLALIMGRFCTVVLFQNQHLCAKDENYHHSGDWRGSKGIPKVFHLSVTFLLIYTDHHVILINRSLVGQFHVMTRRVDPLGPFVCVCVTDAYSAVIVVVT